MRMGPGPCDRRRFETSVSAIDSLPRLFETLGEIQEFATNWLWTYNHDRPNIALGGITPRQKLALAA